MLYNFSWRHDIILYRSPATQLMAKKQEKCDIDVLLSVVMYSVDFWTPCCRCIDRKKVITFRNSLGDLRRDYGRNYPLDTEGHSWLLAVISSDTSTGAAWWTLTDLQYFQEDFKNRVWVFHRHLWREESLERTQRLADCWNAHKVHIVNAVFEV